MIQKELTDSHNLERIIYIFDLVSLILLKFIVIFEAINSLDIMKFADLIKTILHNSFKPLTVLLFLKKL
jgi:hypothetical protein